MKVLLSVCLVLCLALSADAVRVRTHSKSRSTTSQGWEYYLQEGLYQKGQSSGAAIIGLDGNVWAQIHLSLKAGEGAAIAKLFKSPANVFASGVTVGGIKYMGIKGDERSIYAKKGATGVILVKTSQTIIISVYDEKVQPGNAANVVEKLADYLLENGY